MSEFILSKLPELDNNGRSGGFKHATIKKMICELLTNDRLVQMEVKQMRYSPTQLANKLSISVEELRNFMSPITKLDVQKGTRGHNFDMGMEVLKLYCKTKFST